VIAVNEVHIRVSRRTEQDGVARSESGEGVRGGIVCAQVGFIFNNASREQFSSLAPDEQLAQQLASYRDRIAIEKLAREYSRRS